MKAKLCFFTLLFIGTMLNSCKKSDISYESNFERSYKEWLSFKETAGNSYSYIVSGASVFGPSWQTVITVTDGKATQRHFKFTLVDAANIPADALEWIENENEINSHEYTSAAEALTLDQIYDKARNHWLKKRKNAKTCFEAKNNGLISSCGYVEDGCMDDCFIGINITSIESL